MYAAPREIFRSDHRAAEADAGSSFSTPGAEPLGGSRQRLRLLDGHRSVTGVAVRTRFGPVRGKITVKGGRITDGRCPAG
ncbi:hypothetical protein ACIQ6K_31570 [Streptomyces sp. NPDC096354]|uniref:hypothetical protein n=1 Tax=Streptomyces sp. NPDC096354 TaxID=3366088 RepID=UPI0037F30B06